MIHGGNVVMSKCERMKHEKRSLNQSRKPKKLLPPKLHSCMQMLYSPGPPQKKNSKYATEYRFYYKIYRSRHSTRQSPILTLPTISFYL